MVPRTGSYTYDASVWDLSIIQRPLAIAPCQKFRVTIRNLFSSLYRCRLSAGRQVLAEMTAQKGPASKAVIFSQSAMAVNHVTAILNARGLQASAPPTRGSHDGAPPQLPV
jgi:hypothetical protein